jgi:hypothetical protein
MSIRVKITPKGGYVLGDGPCPFDPDEFLIMFGDKVIEAQRAGMEELLIDDFVIDAALADAHNALRAEVAGAPVHEFPDNADPRRLLG